MKTATFVLGVTTLVAGSVAASPVSYDQYLTEVARVNAEDASHFNPLIVGGSEVPEYSHTYVSGMRSSSGGRSFCGGSLIAPKWVLTAAHCQSSIEYVSVGTHYRAGATDGKQVKVVRKIPHPKYTSASSSGYDVLLLELEEAVTEYSPVALAQADGSDEQVNTTSTTLGWGLTSEWGSASDVLRSVDVGIVSNEECSKAYSSINPSMVCAGGLGGKDSCQGDSGGPLIVKGEEGDVLVGVVSWGRGCARLGYPGVYARVSSVLDFISDYVKDVRLI